MDPNALLIGWLQVNTKRAADFMDPSGLDSWPIEQVRPSVGEWGDIPLYVFERMKPR